MPARTFFTASSGFEAACRFDQLPAAHPCHRLHGHSFLAHVRCMLPPQWAAFAGGEVEALRASLAARVAPLDHRLLNDVLAQPFDENIARWLCAHLDVPDIHRVGIQSTARQGVDLDRTGRAHAWRRYAFRAAHRLPNVRPGHKCGRMHGHGFEVIVHANLGADHDTLDALWSPLQEQLDLTCLNDLPGLENPTSELLCSWIWQRLQPALPALSFVTVRETGTSGAHYDGQRYGIWKEFSLDSALQLKRAPHHSRLRRIHGHTYSLRLHLSAPLDAVMGWAMDFGDVKELFLPIFERLDHQPLHEISDLADCDTATLAQWILGESSQVLPALDRVDLYETPGCGAIVTADEEGPALPV
ncbi:MAG TPA: 6-carboxytetrahydropterin synthase [Burkholderiaceae bacterium]|nr:6-carboxytetrahydropterin synthase [Burkholderiaceae bacterium]